MKKKLIISLICVVIGFLTFLLIFQEEIIPAELHEHLEYIFNDFVDGDDLIYNAIVLVKDADNNLVWQGSKVSIDYSQEEDNNIDTPFFIASITKLFTATLIMQLYEEGIIDLDNSIADYLPEEIYSQINVYKGVDYSNKISVRHLLSHSSGIADYYTGKPNKSKGLFNQFLKNPSQKWTVDDTIEWTKNELSANNQPGKSHLYSDTNYQLLGKIIENVLQKDLGSAYQQYIFYPLGLHNTYLIQDISFNERKPVADIFHYEQNVSNLRYNGSYRADGGIVSTANDCITFLHALRTGRLISNDTLSLMQQWEKLSFPIQYGFGIMLFKLPNIINYFTDIPELWGHSGSSGSFLYYSEDLNLYIAGTINQSSSNIKPFLLMGEILRTIKNKSS